MPPLYPTCFSRRFLPTDGGNREVGQQTCTNSTCPEVIEHSTNDPTKKNIIITPTYFIRDN